MDAEVINQDAVEQEEVAQEVVEQDDVAAPAAQEASTEPDEVIITIGDAKPDEEDQAAPQWVKDLRVKHREAQKELRELKEKLQAQTQQQVPAIGVKPTLEGCAYDDSKYEAELAAWFERKRKSDEHQAKIEADQRKQQETWQAKLDNYNKAKTELKVKDYADAESTVQEIFNQAQQGIIVHGAKNPALVVYALGKNPAKAKELAALTDPVQFAVAIGELTKDIQMKPREKPPAPEKVPSGSGSLSGGIDGTLERLRSEAEKTGDYTKVMQYRKQLREKK